MTTNSSVSLTTRKPSELIKEFRKNVAQQNKSWKDLCLDAFHIQYHHNLVYKSFVDALGVKEDVVQTITEIPFLPIEFFKSKQVVTGEWDVEKVFKSSGTTATGRSEHEVDDFNFYLGHAIGLFVQHYGDLSELGIIALLPSYLEQGDSSLIAMVDELIQLSDFEYSDYYLSKSNDLLKAIMATKSAGRTAFIIGVSFALLDLAESGKIDLSECVIMETGGMKGRRKELIRTELHGELSETFGVDKIHSEYGMTELLSQAYSKGDGLFEENNWLKCLIRDINDPLTYQEDGKTGGLNVIDLANIHSCCFVETKDLGVKHLDGRVEILGRFDNSDIRGCNLLL
ncbi:MAG: acyl transferase [Bacteroidota bacterium]